MAAGDCDLFQHLSDSDVERLSEFLEEKSYKKGEYVFKEGDESDGFYIVLEGEIEVVKEGSDTPIAILGQNQPVGELSIVVKDEPRSASVRAGSDSALAHFRQDKFLELLDKGEGLAYKIVYAVSQALAFRLREMNSHYVELINRMEGPPDNEPAVTDGGKYDFPEDLRSFRKKLGECFVS